MRARAEQTQQTRQRILDAAYALFLELPYDEVTLQAVADGAGVSVQTVLRHVGSKDGLLRAGLSYWEAEENERRKVVPGDVDDVARVLTDRYESPLSPAIARIWELEARVPVLAEMLQHIRQSHANWLAEVFAEQLPAGPPSARKVCLAQLFGATEQKVWVLWRTNLGMSRAQAQRAMADTLRAIVDSWRADS